MEDLDLIAIWRNRAEAAEAEVTRLRERKLEPIDLWATRPFAWVQTHFGWVLALGDAGLLFLVADAGGWKVYHQPDREAGWLRVWEGQSLGYAQGAAEEFCRGRGADKLAKRVASWRRDPASAAQKNMLQRWRLVPGVGLTKGEAADRLTRAIAEARWRLRERAIEATWSEATAQALVETRERAEAAERACAALREVAQFAYDWIIGSPTADVLESTVRNVIGDALTAPTPGAGYVTPEEHARVVGERHRLAQVLHVTGDCCSGADPRCAAGCLQIVATRERWERLAALEAQNTTLRAFRTEVSTRLSLSGHDEGNAELDAITYLVQANAALRRVAEAAREYLDGASGHRHEALRYALRAAGMLP